jgi:hypothetical protein
MHMYRVRLEANGLVGFVNQPAEDEKAANGLAIDKAFVGDVPFFVIHPSVELEIVATKTEVKL